MQVAKRETSHIRLINAEYIVGHGGLQLFCTSGHVYAAFIQIYKLQISQRIVHERVSPVESTAAVAATIYAIATVAQVQFVSLCRIIIISVVRFVFGADGG